MNNAKNELLVLNIDFDGCTDTPLARQKLADYIVSICLENPHYKEISIIIGSLRQSLLLDLINAHNNAYAHDGQLFSCAIILDEFYSILNVKLQKLPHTPPKVNKINFLTYDLYNNLPIGTTFNSMQTKTYNQMFNPQNFDSLPIVDNQGENISKLSLEELIAWRNQFSDGPDELEQYLNQQNITQQEFDNYIYLRQSQDHRLRDLINISQYPDLRTINIFDYQGRNISYYTQEAFEEWISFEDDIERRWCISAEEFQDYIDWREENEHIFESNEPSYPCHAQINLLDQEGKNISDYTYVELLQWMQQFEKPYKFDDLLQYFSVNRSVFEDYLSWRQLWSPLTIMAENNHGEQIKLLEMVTPGQYQAESHPPHSDTSKCLTIYTQYQYIAHQNHQPFDLLFIDDRIDLLTSIESCFQQAPYLIPNGSSLKCIEWNSDAKYDLSHVTNRITIIGNGVINHSYAKDVCKIMQEYNSHHGEKQIPDLLIKNISPEDPEIIAINDSQIPLGFFSRTKIERSEIHFCPINDAEIFNDENNYNVLLKVIAR